MRPKPTDALSAILDRLRLRAGVFFHGEYCGNWAVDTSGHRKVPFHLIGRGDCWLHLEGRPYPVLLRAGDFVVFPHDTHHTLCPQSEPPEASSRQASEPTGTGADAEGPVTSLLCGYLEFQGKAAWPLLDGLPDVIVVDLRECGRLTGTYGLIQLILGELEQEQPGMEVTLNELAYVLFIHVLRAQMQRGLDRGLLCALADPKVGAALNLIHAEPGRDWTLQEMAQGAGMSRSAFAERFRQLVGVTPIRYVTEWRMQEAVDLLQTTDLSVADIAERSGYASEVAFRKAFRTVIGEPPGRVRRAARTASVEAT